MDQRRGNELDEFEKLLGEIPKVTSGNDYNHFPICLSSSRSSQSIKKMDQFEGHYLPDDRAFTTSFSEANLHFGIPNQAPESPHPLFINPTYHSPSSSPCVYDKFDSRKLDPVMFRKLQQVGCFPNFSSGISPAQPQHYLPHSQSLSHYQSPMNWRNLEEEKFPRLKLQEEQYLSMNPHFLHLYNNNQGMDTVPRQEHFDYRRAEQSNRNLFWNGEDGNESVRNMDGVRKMCYPEKILMRSQLDLNTAKVIKYGAGDDSQNGRLWLQNQLNEDLTMSLNNLSLQPQKYNSLAEARGKIYYLAKDQHGCRFLQRIFAEKDGNDIEMIFDEIIDYISELMIDPFGNYLVQKLLEVCNEDQRMQIVHSITRKPGLLIKISCDMHGTRAVQKIVETAKREEEISIIISALKHGIVNLIKNVNGNHVVQRCLQYLLPHCGKFLFEAAITHCVDLATDRHGCCVLQKCLGYSEGEQKQHLVSEIASNALLLSQDPFGNYVLQYVFELQLQWATFEILEQLEGNYTELSMQKCSSNVVEKCLKLADDKHRARIIRELINYGRLDQVMLDPYGNYVIQAALKQSKGNVHALLVDAIKLHISSLRTNPYGKKVLSALSSKK
ncbi:Pumilio RNA-binding repeat [Arabidopsis suecica]|uniref:Pumilio RNA-binding repeat n=1 Tax=Arabidopsis suecica TaxID=45249 RepID=A0A8T1XU85_ARASU|nr:Pumilio RNA-binding repeat [Arabidopsis suecica]KAG7538191.1 Pumilio RNA-binding repeat [Arabidopsis suecica]KAG7538192.1 Pumilio RNA-binding repeat [Arabidopsis suecica]